MGKSPRISVSLDEATYEQLKTICYKSNQDMSAYIRNLIESDLDGQLTRQNIDFISAILREQLDIMFKFHLERLIKLTSTTCIQAGTAAYLSAEAISSFVPLSYQQDFNEAYNKARKKALAYVKAQTSSES